MMGRYFVALAIMTAVLAGCGTLPGASGTASSGPEIALLSGGLLRGTDGGPELGVTLQNRSGTTLAIEVTFVTPGSTQNCVQIIELAGGDRAALFCPQPGGVVADQDYSVQVRGFTDPDALRPVVATAETVRFSAADVAMFPPPRPASVNR